MMKLTPEFNTKNPELLNEAKDNAQALEAVRKIEERRITLAQKLEQHVQKHRDLWIAREAEKLHTQETQRLHYSLPQPRSFRTHQSYWNDHLYQATQAVDARIDARLHSLDTISRRMQNDAVQQITAQQSQQHLARQRLDLEVREIHQSTHCHRMDAYHDFENHKVQRVEEARRNKSPSPERDVYTAYQQQDRNILADQENRLRQAYEKHGFNYDMERHALTQKYNQNM